MGRVRQVRAEGERSALLGCVELGISNHYEPDFLVKLADDVTLVLEIKRMVTDQDNTKHEAAKRGIAAVNNWGQLERWGFHVNRDPQMLGVELRHLAREASITGQPDWTAWLPQAPLPLNCRSLDKRPHLRHNLANN